MGELLRRRAMTKSQKAVETWDFEWTYTDGLLSDNGWSREISGTGSESIDDTGLILRSDLNSFVRLSNSNFVMPVGVIEVTCSIPGYSDSNFAQNLRVCLSNGVNGVQVYENTGFWRLMDSTGNPYTGTSLVPFNSSQEYYTIRLELDNDSFSVFIDEDLIYEGSSSSIVYATKTFVMSQNQYGGASIIKAIKIKRNRLV